MKVAVQCDSPLLQRSLELFLSGNLSSLKQCDVVIRDKKVDDGLKSLYIGTGEDVDLVKPFSRSQLFMTLEQMFHDEKMVQQIQQITDDMAEMEEPAEKGGEGDVIDFSILERQIEKLTKEYQESVMKAVRAFYER